MAPRDSVKNGTVLQGENWYKGRLQALAQGDSLSAAASHQRTAWSTKPGEKACSTALPDEFRDACWLAQLQHWEQNGVIDYATEQLRYGLIELGLEDRQADALVWQFGEAAEQWLFIGHAGEQRTRCRQELHADLGSLLGNALAAEQLESATLLLSEAWLLMHVWDTPEINVRLTYGLLQEEIRQCLAYSIVKDSVRDSVAHLMLYITACSPESPFFVELNFHLQRVKPDTAEVVNAYKQFFSTILRRINEPATVH